MFSLIHCHVKCFPVSLWQSSQMKSTMTRCPQKVTDLQSCIRTIARRFEMQHSTLQKASSCFLWPSSFNWAFPFFPQLHLSNPSWVSVSPSPCVFSYLLLSSSATLPPLSHYQPPPILSTSPFPKSNIILLGLEHSAPRPPFIQSICLSFLLKASIPELLHLSSCFLEILQHWANPKADFASSCRRGRIVCDISLIFQLLLLDSSEILPKSPASQTTVISESQIPSISSEVYKQKSKISIWTQNAIIS